MPGTSPRWRAGSFGGSAPARSVPSGLTTIPQTAPARQSSSAPSTAMTSPCPVAGSEHPSQASDRTAGSSSTITITCAGQTRMKIAAPVTTRTANEMTPTLKVRRRVVEEKYGQLVDSIYGGVRDELFNI